MNSYNLIKLKLTATFGEESLTTDTRRKYFGTNSRSVCDERSTVQIQILIQT